VRQRWDDEIMARYGFIIAILLTVGGCGSETPVESVKAEPAERPTVFDPLVRSLDRAEGVQQILDEHAAEQRRRIEEAEQ
jgi:hypothetical protein